MKAVVAIIAGLMAWVGQAIGQTTWYVDDDACPGPGAGSDHDPFCLMQSAIDAAIDGDTVLVAPGTYAENLDFLGKAIAVLSSDGPAATIIDGGGVGRCVIFQSEEGASTVLEGFTIQGGSPPSGGGGGVACVFSSPTIRNLVIRWNHAVASGGGLFCHTASPYIESCVIVENDSGSWGAALSASRVPSRRS